MPDFSKLESVDRKLLDCAQIQLKKEWNRVKFGEYFYRAVTAFAGLLVIGGLYLLFRSSTHQAAETIQEQYVISSHTITPANSPEAPADEYAISFAGEVLKVRYSDSQTSSAKPGDPPGAGLHMHSWYSNPDLSQIPPVVC